MKNSAILRAEDNFEQIKLPGIVMHIDGNDGTRPRASQEILIAHLAILLAQTAHLVHLITVIVHVEQLIIIHEQAVHALAINVHLLRVLLASVELQLVELGLPALPIKIRPRNLFPLGRHGPHFAILYINMLQTVLPLRHVIKEELLEVEGFLQGLLVLLEPEHAVQVLSIAVEESVLSLWPLLVRVVEHPDVLPCLAHHARAHHAATHAAAKVATTATWTAHHVVCTSHTINLLLVHWIALWRPHTLVLCLIHVRLLTRSLGLLLRYGNICGLRRLVAWINGEGRCLYHQIREISLINNFYQLKHNINRKDINPQTINICQKNEPKLNF